MPHFYFALLLALSVALAPLGLDTYLPAFPEIALVLGVPVHQLSLTVSVYVAALAAGQLVGGPLSDRYGRQPVMLAGLFLFGAASLAIAAMSDFRWMLFWRCLQAFGGGWAMSCVPALVRDRSQGKESARLFSLIGLIMVVAPTLAPMIGNVLRALSGWRSIFVFLAVYAVMAGLATKQVLFRGQMFWAQREVLSSGFLQRYKTVLAIKPARRYLLVQSLAFSTMLLFVSHASFIYQKEFGVTPTVFSLLFGANVVCIALINMLNRRLLNRFAPASLMVVGVILQLCGVLALLLVMGFASTIWLFAPAMMLTVGATGMTGPNNQACFMEYFAENGGTAGALMGALQFGASGLITALAALLPESILSIVLAQAVCVTAALCAAVWPVKANH